MVRSVTQRHTERVFEVSSRAPNSPRPKQMDVPTNTHTHREKEKSVCRRRAKVYSCDQTPSGSGEPLNQSAEPQPSQKGRKNFKTDATLNTKQSLFIYSSSQQRIKKKKKGPSYDRVAKFHNPHSILRNFSIASHYL